MRDDGFTYLRLIWLAHVLVHLDHLGERSSNAVPHKRRWTDGLTADDGGLRCQSDEVSSGAVAQEDWTVTLAATICGHHQPPRFCGPPNELPRRGAAGCGV